MLANLSFSSTIITSKSAKFEDKDMRLEYTKKKVKFPKLKNFENRNPRNWVADTSKQN